MAVKVNEKVLTAAKAKLVKLSEAWTAGVTRGKLWDIDGKDTGADHTHCHSWIPGRNNYYGPLVKNQLVLSCHSKKRSKGICSVEAHEAIIKWVASDECPLSQYILNRDDEDSLLNGGVVILIGPDGATGNETLWICKVLRYAVEHGQALDVWLELVKAGVNPLLALYVCSFVRTVKGATFSYTGPYSHVCVFHGDAKDAYLQQLMRGEVYRKADCTPQIFGKEMNNAYPAGGDNRLKSFCAPMKKDDGWGGSVVDDAASKEEFIKHVLAWQAELEGKGGGVKAAVKRLVSKKPTKTTVYLEEDM
jgi:hypothetical protein